MKKAFCFDLDGTITSHEILPHIGKEVGLYSEIEELTRSMMRGEIPYEASFKLRFQLLKTIPLSKIHKAMSEIQFHEELLQLLSKIDGDKYIITNNVDIWIEPIVKKLNIPFFSSRAAVNGDKIGRLTYINRKGDVIKKLRNKYDFITSVGDGVNDVPMFEKSDISVAFNGIHNAAEILLKSADCVVSSERGLCKLLKML